MKIIERPVTKSPLFAKTEKMKKVEGLVLHGVGCAQPSANVFIKLWDVPTFNSYSVTAIIDANTGDVYKLRDWDARSAHVGGAANNTHIGVETCEPPNIKYTGVGAKFECSDIPKAMEYVTRTYNSAVELFAYLCLQYGLDPLEDGVILSHKEASLRGLGSAHGDIDHLWEQLGAPYTMDIFRKDVNTALKKLVTPQEAPKVIYRVRKSWDDVATQKGAFTVLENAIASAESWGSGEHGYKVFDQDGNCVYPIQRFESYHVKIDVYGLRIRTGPGIDYPIVSTVPKGVYTIVEEKQGIGSKSGWGLLAAFKSSRNGWISLDYAEKF